MLNNSALMKWVAAVLMLISAVAAYVLTPTQAMYLARAEKLDALIPKQIGTWTMDKEGDATLVVSADIEQKLSEFYSETLSRTYLGPKGERIMLSIAYGKVQSDKLRVHDPKLCYAAQGFEVKDDGLHVLSNPYLEVRQAIANQGRRIEPITYWILVGDTVANESTPRKLQQLKYGFQGLIPDGMLIRVSTIGDNFENEYQLQRQFVADLYTALPVEKRKFIFGAGE